jgi:hypothetical protein
MQITKSFSCAQDAWESAEAPQGCGHCDDPDGSKACWSPELVAQSARNAGLARRVSFRESERVLSLQRLMGG